MKYGVKVGGGGGGRGSLRQWTESVNVVWMRIGVHEISMHFMICAFYCPLISMLIIVMCSN